MSRPPPGQRSEYRWFHAITTRWMDNDVFQHVNNVNYFSYFDTAVTYYEMTEKVVGLLDGRSMSRADLYKEAIFFSPDHPSAYFNLANELASGSSTKLRGAGGRSGLGGPCLGEERRCAEENRTSRGDGETFHYGKSFHLGKVDRVYQNVVPTANLNWNAFCCRSVLSARMTPFSSSSSGLAA